MTAEKQTQRLWIISELYYPELTSTGYYLTQIAESLASEADIRVICGRPNYSARTAPAIAFETRNNVQIRRVTALRLNKNILLFRLLNMLSLSLNIFLRELVSFQKGDAVLVVTTPPLLPVVTAIACLAKGAGYTVLVHDVYPQQLIATGILNSRSVLARSIDVMNRWVYKHSRSIIAVGRDMRDLLEKKVGGLDIPVKFIPNWGETDKITPQQHDENELLRELNFEGKFVILSAGNFGRPNDLETIVAAAELLVEDEKVQFLFIGEGAQSGWLERRTAGLANVLILPPMSREDQNAFLNACDATISSLVRGMWGAAVPSRVYNYMAAGKPVIAVCERDSELARIVADDDIGAFVAPGDADGLASTIRDLIASPDLCRKMATNARSAALNKYSANTVLPQYRIALLGDK
jgi:glycosyltransferase involved in cell wall biosynthesis